MATPDILQRIIATTREETSRRRNAVSEAKVRAQALAKEPARGFADALQRRVAARRPAVIAEVKRASPSKGVLRDPFDVTAIAESYAASQATCLSVLTDAPYFKGSEAYLTAARAACGLPVLRKDFVVEPWQVWETRAMGADCLLLIVSALDDATLAALYETATEAGLDVLVEVHDSAELRRASALEPRMIGINNRNLHTFETSLAITEQLLPEVPECALLVTESGIRTRQDVERMLDHGVYGFLVGEAFMVEPDPGAMLDVLFAT
jgi:indole-3-glycerol phosphate synthase